MMPFDAIAPSASERGSPNTVKKYPSGSRMRTFAAFQNLEHFIQAHDADGFDVALLAEAGGQERVRELLLLGSHVAQRNAFSWLGNIVPVEALIVGEIET